MRFPIRWPSWGEIAFEARERGETVAQVVERHRSMVRYSWCVLCRGDKPFPGAIICEEHAQRIVTPAGASLGVVRPAMSQADGCP